FVFFSSRRRHARFSRDWSSDVCSSDLPFHSGTLANKPISRTRCLMDELWTTLPHARRVLQHAQDARPAWLWLQDGQKLIWANERSEERRVGKEGGQGEYEEEEERKGSA